MTDREKLAELIAKIQDYGYKTVYEENAMYMRTITAEELADHLVAHGVTVRKMQKPLTVEELEKSIWQIPCWVEERGGDLFPEVLDRDSVGYFGRIDAAHDRPITHYLKYRINETWRCWAEKPTEEERRNAKWEVE